MKYLREKGANFYIRNNDDRTPLYLAAKSDHLSIVKYLIEEGMGSGSIFDAAKSGDLGRVKYHVDVKGADFNVRNDQGNTLLHHAVMSCNLDTVKYLVDKGAYVNIRNNYYGRTPLYCAIGYGCHLDIVKCLIDGGAYVNIKEKIDGNTPLHHAVNYGRLDVVKYLIEEKKADYSIRNDRGWAWFSGETAFEMASRINSRIEEYFKSKGIRSRRSIAEKVESSLENDEMNYNKGKVTSGASKPSSWIDAVKGVFQFISSPFKPAIGIESSQPSKARITQGIDTNGTLLLLDVFIRKITGQKYISTADQPTISLQEAECHASDIINGFEKVLKETAVKSGISVTNLNFDPIKPQSAIVGQLRNGKFSEISKILYSSAKQACPECKQTKRFLGRLETCIEGFLDKKELSSIGQKLRIEEAKQIRKQELCSSANFITDNPKTYLSDPTIDKQLQGSCHTISS